jgi:hypothetical protein
VGAEIEICIAKDIHSSCLAQFCLQQCDLGLPLIEIFFEAGKPIPKSKNGRRIAKIQTRTAILKKILKIC